MPVTPSGITTVPMQLVCPVTSLLAIVKYPLVPQSTEPVPALYATGLTVIAKVRIASGLVPLVAVIV